MGFTPCASDKPLLHCTGFVFEVSAIMWCIYLTLLLLRQGLVTAPILFALEEHPQMHELIDRRFKSSDDVNLVTYY